MKQTPRASKKNDSKTKLCSASISDAKIVAGSVRKRRESPLPEPVELGLESLYLSCLGPGKVNEAAPCGDAPHSPSGLFGRGCHVHAQDKEEPHNRSKWPVLSDLSIYVPTNFFSRCDCCVAYLQVREQLKKD